MTAHKASVLLGLGQACFQLLARKFAFFGLVGFPCLWPDCCVLLGESLFCAWPSLPFQHFLETSRQMDGEAGDLQQEALAPSQGAL